MSDLINVPISSSLFARLQSLATPLVDDTSSVIERLVGHWESSPPNISVSNVPAAAVQKTEFWRSAHGDMLPIGASLQAKYLGKTFCASVEKRGIVFDGKVYDSPSAAGVAVKGQLGRTGPASNTDGRKFWKIQDPSSERLVSISTLYPSQPVDVQALLAELDNL